MPFSAEEAYEVGEKIGINWDEVEFDSEAFAVGMELELEHGSVDPETDVTGDDPEETAKIAWAHLKESPIYYDLLAEMEAQFKEGEETEEERTGRSKKAYQIQVDPSKKPGGKPTLSLELDQYVKEYVKDLESAVSKGTSANDAFKEILPDLDDLEADDLVNLLWENKHLGGRGALERFKDWLPALDIFDLIQKMLERAIWESAVYWWSTQKTEKQQDTDQESSTETVVIKKKPGKGTGKEDTVPIDDAKTTERKGSFWYRGHQYVEWKR